MKILLKRITAALLIFTALLPQLTACSHTTEPPQNNDNDNENGDDNMNSYYITMKKNDITIDPIIEYENPAILKNNPHLKQHVTTDISYGDEFASLKWNAVSGLQIQSPMISDWSEYDTLRIAVYSETATNSPVQIRFNNPQRSNTTAMAPYYRYVINVDFTGFKVFDINLSEMASNYAPVLNEIISINFDCTGWDMTPNAKNVLYFGNMYLCKTEWEFISEVPVDDPELYEDVTAKWRASLVGDPENIPDTAEYRSVINSISRNCENSWNKFKNTYDGTENSAWDLNITFGNKGDEVKINTIYSHILNMAKGYEAKGSEFYHDPQLLSDIKTAYEYAYTYYYGDCVKTKGTYGNWWHWDIGIPLSLTRSLIILEHALPYEDIVKYLSPFDHLNKYPSMTACNKVWITYCILASAFLQKDCERILISKEKMNDVFDYVTQGDGFYTDGSFIQHNKHPYTGGYGLSMINEVTNLLYALGGSRFAFHGENVNNHYTWIFENFRPVIYNGNLFASVRGREVCRNTSENAAQRTAVAAMIKMQDYAPKDIQDKLIPLIKHYMTVTKNNYASHVPLTLIEFSTNLYNDDSVTPDSDYNITKVFGNMDRVVQHNNKYGVCLALSSTRVFKYESINQENMNAWYHGDGAIYLYTDGYDYSNKHFNNLDPYRIPGTTVSSVKRTEEVISKNILNSSAFAGGVESGRYGLAVFELGYPKDNGYVNTDIGAKKSYFLFDNEIVAIGSAISDSSDTKVSTIIENRMWNSGDVLTINGKKILSPSNTDKKETVTSMHFTNMGGYVFLEETDVVYRRNTQKTDFLEIITEHGKNPENEKYAYVYLPEATDAQTLEYTSAPDISILTHTNNIHVVKENKLNTTGYAFYAAGTANGVTVNAPCAIMVRVEDGKTYVSVSDPTHLLKELKITLQLSDVSEVEYADTSVSATVSSNTVTLDINTEGNVGNTYEVILR